MILTKFLASLAFATAFIAPSIASAAQIDCSGETIISAGIHTGHLTDIISRLDWSQDSVHFIFHDFEDNHDYCVRQSTSNDNIVAIAVKAMTLRYEVMITTDGDYNMTGIAFNASA